MADCNNNNNTKNTQGSKGPVKSINVPDKSAKVSVAADNSSKAGTKGAILQNSEHKSHVTCNLTSKISTTKPDASGKGGKHIDALFASDNEDTKAVKASTSAKQDKVSASPPVEDEQKDLEKTDSDMARKIKGLLTCLQ